jgi:thiol-disulfide isomerase/thioredoxin
MPRPRPLLPRLVRRALAIFTLLSAASSLSPLERVAAADAAKPSAPGWLGVEMAPATGGKGVSVVHVIHGSPAERGGVVEGDRLLAVDGVTVTAPADVSGAASRVGAGKVLAITVARGKDVLILRVSLVAKPSRDQVFRMDAVGQRLPSTSALKLVTGPGPVDLAKLSGKVVIVDLFATWCGPCAMLGPHYRALHEKYGPQGLAIIAVSDETSSVLSTWSAKNSVAYSVATDPDDAFAQRVLAPALPSSLIVDKHGVVREVTIGYEPSQVERTEKLVQALLKEP